MYCFSYCSVGTVLVIGSVVHADMRTNGDNHGYYGSSRSAVHFKVGNVGAINFFGSKGRLLPEQMMMSKYVNVFRPLRPEFYTCLAYIFGMVQFFLYLRHDMRQMICRPSVMVGSRRGICGNGSELLLNQGID